MFESLFNNAAGLKVCNFIKKRLQHRSFALNTGNLQERSLFYRTPVVAVSEIVILKGYFFVGLVNPFHASDLF